MTTISAPAAAGTVQVAFDAADLKSALARVKPAMGKYGAPSLSHVRVSFLDSVALLTATNIEITLSTSVPAAGFGEGSFLVPFAKLDKALRVYKSGTVTLTAADDSVTVTNGKRQIELRTVPVGEFPVLAPVVGRTVALDLNAIREVAPAASTDDTRPILTGVRVADGSYVATDSYRMSVLDTPNDTGAAFLLPRPFATIASKYKGTVTAVVSDRHIEAVLDAQTTLTAILVEGQFPEYKRLFPTAPVDLVSFDATLAPELKALLALGFEAGTPLRITGHADGVELSISQQDVGTARVVVPGTVRGGLTIGFNPNYLLSNLAGTTSGSLQGTDHLKPAVVSESAPEYGDGAVRRRLIMPIRIS